MSVTQTQQDQTEPTASAEQGKYRGRTIVHLCVDIRGLLRRKNSELKGWITDGDGKLLNPEQARESLLDELAKGRKVLPTGPCEGFSYETGCPGHPEEGASHA